MKKKKKIKTNILKINKNESLLANQHELKLAIRILRDDQEQFSINKKKLQISKIQINNCIKEHHDESLTSHSKVIKILQFLRQNCQFANMRQHVEAYVKKCFSCQKNKHVTHKKYEKI